jgi:hypothetical protein
MSDYSKYYQQAAQDAENTGSTMVGEVNVKMTEVKLHENGACQVVFQHTFQSGKTIDVTCWINPTDPEQVTVFDGQTKEVAIQKAFTRELKLFKQLAREVASEEKVESEFKTITCFEDNVNALNNCLQDSTSTEGRLVIGYNKKGFYACPNRLQWDAASKRNLPFFSTNPDQKLMDLPSNLSLVKPAEATEETTTQTVEF